MLDKLRNIKWYDWAIIGGIGLLVVGIGLNWKSEERGRVEILFKENEIVEVFNIEPEVLGEERVGENVEEKIVGLSGKINLNKADVLELTKLVGIGPKTAEKIIEYRENNNDFKNIEEIKLVKGIGEKMYEKIKDNLEI